jgi:DNA-binding response OmpR family regulator
MRILVVEDDIYLSDMLKDALTDERYAVDIVSDGEMAWDWLQTLPYDLILLDLTLPKLDGISFCRRLRSYKFPQSVLMLTARDTLADKVTGLDAGADDYLVKPFEMPELMARIRALLRRGSLPENPTLSWGNLTVNSSIYEVKYEAKALSLTPKEYALLELLVINGRRVMSRAGIIERIWTLDDPPSEETIKSHIKSLRQKLRVVGAPDDFIETIYGLGYRLKAIAEPEFN